MEGIKGRIWRKYWYTLGKRYIYLLYVQLLKSKARDRLNNMKSIAQDIAKFFLKNPSSFPKLSQNILFFSLYYSLINFLLLLLTLLSALLFLLLLILPIIIFLFNFVLSEKFPNTIFIWYEKKNCFILFLFNIWDFGSSGNSGNLC